MTDKAERSLYEDIKNIKKLIDRAELELIKIRGFLTLEEAEERAFYFYEYQENAYYYEIDETSNSGVLIENEEVLVESVDDGRWYEPGVYKYKIAGRGWTLVENGEVLIDGADFVHWEASRTYQYRKDDKDDKYTLIENGEVLIDGADNVQRYEPGLYICKKDGKWTLIEHGKVLFDNVDDVLWYKPGFYRYAINDKIFEVKDGITTKIY